MTDPEKYISDIVKEDVKGALERGSITVTSLSPTISSSKQLDPFIYVAPTEKQLYILNQLRAKCKELNDLQNALLPPGRYRSLATTELEKVSAWQNKACVFELAAE